MDASSARAKYAAKMNSVDWGGAASSWNEAKSTMSSHYTFGGKAKRKYDAAIQKANYRAPTSSEISAAIENFNRATS